MTDQPLFDLNKNRRLAYDGHQWIIQKRSGKAKVTYSGISFVATSKRVLLEVIREKGIKLSEQAIADLDKLPDTFNEFRSALLYDLKVPGPLSQRV